MQRERTHTQTFKARLFIVLAGLLGISFLLLRFSGHTQAQIPLGGKPPLTEELFRDAEALYKIQCASCHGMTGQADGSAAYLLYPKPRDFVHDHFRLVSQGDMEARDEDLFKTISRGMPGSAMPPWSNLTEEERWSLVYYVQYLRNLGREKESGQIQMDVTGGDLSWAEKERLARPQIDPEAAVTVPEEPSATDEGIANGRELFIKACASCHGPEGRGDGQQAMKDQLGYPVRPRDLTAGIFKGESSSEALFYRIAAGLPGSPMPGYKEAFTEEQIWDLIHYIQTLPEEGAEERAQLNRVQVAAGKTASDLSLDPLDKAWESIAPAVVTLTPLWWRDERVESVEVRARRNSNHIEIRLSWPDAGEDQAMVQPQSFSDGAAIQLSGDPAPPFFAMGSDEDPVVIWHWKASWQKEAEQWLDVESQYPNLAVDWYESETTYEHASEFEAGESKTENHNPLLMTGWGAGNPLSNPRRMSAAEEARALGFGSFTTMQPGGEPLEAKGAWRDGKWHVVFRRVLSPKDGERIRFAAGETVSISFAVWDGGAGDRNGQKSVSLWSELVLEP